MPLAHARTGETVRVVAINAGRGLQARLAAMGITPGSRLTVKGRNDHGPFVVAVRDSRVALGRGMVSKIEVE
jgi:ferrous iron transport protein A